MEIWGLGNEDNIEHQKALFQMDVKLAEQSKKIDKAALMEGDFNKEFILEKTFAHKEGAH